MALTYLKIRSKSCCPRILENVKRGSAEAFKSYEHVRTRLGGVVVSVLATGPKGCGSKPGQGDGFLRAIKIRRPPSSRMGSKAGRSHVVRFYGM
jgi:hypothetical protein